MNPLVVIVFAVIPVAAFVIGVQLARKPDNQLANAEKRELLAQRRLLNELTALAGEHIALGDSFATIALNKINNTRNELT